MGPVEQVEELKVDVAPRNGGKSNSGLSPGAECKIGHRKVMKFDKHFMTKYRFGYRCRFLRA
jgi:hypothetical protein